jgi:hypothetical protein
VTIEWTADGILISGRIRLSDSKRFLRWLAASLSKACGERADRSGTGAIMSETPGAIGGEPPDEPLRRGGEEADVLDWDDLIPVAPPRPRGRLRVHLKKAGTDEPLPADDPWAK